MGHVLKPIPTALADLFAYRGYYAGDWEISLEGSLSRGSGQQINRATRPIAIFLSCFPWMLPQQAGISFDDGPRESWTSGQAEFAHWLAEISGTHVASNGIEVILAAHMNWQLPSGETGVSLVPHTANFIFSVENETTSFVDLTIYPNVFTNEVVVNRRDSMGNALESEHIEFAMAARKNRSMLESSLRCLEKDVEGKIILWESERVEGIGRYGFAENATPR